MTNILLSLRRLAESIAIVANVFGTLVVLLLVCIVNYDVVVRGMGKQPFLGAVEVVQFSMVLIVFLQLPDVVRANRLTRSDGFLSVTGNRFPRFNNALSRCINTLASVFMLLAAIAMWPEFLEMLETRDFFGVPGIFTAPWWPIKLVIFLSASLSSLLFALMAITPSVSQQQHTPDASESGRKRWDVS